MELREGDIVVEATGRPWRISVVEDPEIWPAPTLWAFAVDRPDFAINFVSLHQPCVLIYRNGEPRDELLTW